MAAKKDEVKAAAPAKTKRAVKAPAAPVEPKLVLQYQGAETDLGALSEAAKAAFKAEKPRTRIQSLTIYVKPEDHAAYYVINEKFDGKLDF